MVTHLPDPIVETREPTSRVDTAQRRCLSGGALLPQRGSRARGIERQRTVTRGRWSLEATRPLGRFRVPHPDVSRASAGAMPNLDRPWARDRGVDTRIVDADLD